MKILLFGSGGQLGHELNIQLSRQYQVIALNRNSHPLCGNLNDSKGIINTIRTVRPSVIINAAAYTAVDLAEKEKENARKINTEIPGLMAREARLQNIWFIHYSTDYVFDGNSQTEWKETDIPAPLNHYGKTKYEGEQRIQAENGQYLILRTSWLYGEHGKNFPKAILHRALQDNGFNVVNDQWGIPTGVTRLANATLHALEQLQADRQGIYHVCPSGKTNWFLYARIILEWAEKHGFPLKTHPDELIPVSSDKYPSPARRPAFAVMGTQKFANTFKYTFPAWETDLKQYLPTLFSPFAT